MGLQKSRSRISARGLGTLSIRPVEPVSGTVFSDAGYLGGTVLHDTRQVEEILADDGMLQDVKIRSQVVTVETMLNQCGRDEIELLRNAADTVHAVRYYGSDAPGRFQYYCFDSVRLNPGLSLEFRHGLRQIPMKFWALSQDERDFTVPLYVVAETGDVLQIEGLQLWVSPRLWLNGLTEDMIDISGFGRHGRLRGYTTPSDVWKSDQAADGYLLFGGNGLEIFASFGDVAGMNALNDMLFEIWIKVEAPQDTECRFFGKRSSPSVLSNSPGYMLYRDADNTIRFWATDGDAILSMASQIGITQLSGWTHVAVAVKRNGESQLFINGAPDGSADTTALGDCTNVEPFLIGCNGAQFGHFSCGDLRVYDFGRDGLPSDFAAIVARHTAAERGFYDL